MSMKRIVCAIVVFVVAGSLAIATPIEVGTGQNTADLYIEWKDGFSVEFAVGFSTDSISGLELIEIAEAGSELEVDTLTSTFGEYVDGISYQEHSDVGYGGGADWWHYWNKDGGHDWISPMFGASDRVVFDGNADGWVYGRDTIPEPASVLLLGLGGLLLRRKERKNI